mgnify:FL=1
MGFDIADYKLQGYLLANAEEIAKKAGRKETTTTFPQPVIIKKAISPSNKATFDTQSDLFNAFSNLNQCDFVTDLPGKVRATKLRPSVKIFKTLRGTEGREVDLELAEQMFTMQGAIEGYGSYGGVSVSDIEIIRLGGNPAEVDTNIKVTITLHGTDLAKFFEKRKPTPLLNFDGDIADLGDAFVQTANKGVAWIDLLKIDLGEIIDMYTAFLNEGGGRNQTTGQRYAPKETVAQVKSSVGAEISEPAQRIKLELAYAEIDDIKGYSQDNADKIKALVASQREVFYLSLVQHEISFNADKSADITISYIGAGGANVISRQNDLLFDPYMYEQELQINDEVSVLNRSAEDPDVLQRAAGVNPPTAEKKSQVFAAIARLEAKKAALKKSQAMLLINGLYGPANLINTQRGQGSDLLLGLDARQARSRVYVHLINPQDMLPSAIAGNLSLVTTKSEPVFGNYHDYLIAKVNSTKFQADRDKMPDLEFRNADTIEELESSMPSTLNDPNYSGNTVLSQIVFLGDIFEVALEVLSSNNRFSTDESFDSKFFNASPDILQTRSDKRNEALFLAQTVLGKADPTINEGMFVRPFYWDPLPGRKLGLTRAVADQAEIEAVKKYNDIVNRPESIAVAEKRIARTYQEFGEFLCSEIVYQSPADANVDIKINLADLPISLYRYKQWFINKILAPRRTTLFLKDFIELLMSDLVAKILSERYNANETSDREPPELLINRFSVLAEDHDFLAKLPQPANAAFNSKTVDNIRQAFKAQKPSSLKAKQLTLFSQPPVIANIPPTIAAIGVNAALAALPGTAIAAASIPTRRATDRDKNIPHIFFSDANNGILRELNFKREDMPGLREARLFEGSDFHGPGIIPEKYNCTLDLKGTTAFKPGSIFYVDPAPLSLGYSKDRQSPARKLGLGGYYLVLRVTHIVNLQGKGEWQTMLDSHWQSFGDDEPLRRSKKTGELKPTSLKARMRTAVDLEDPSVQREVIFSMESMLQNSKKTP